MTITLKIEVKNYCDHKTFEPSCIWCADVRRIAREVKQAAEHKSHFTVVKVKEEKDTQK